MTPARNQVLACTAWFCGGKDEADCTTQISICKSHYNSKTFIMVSRYIFRRARKKIGKSMSHLLGAARLMRVNQLKANAPVLGVLALRQSLASVWRLPSKNPRIIQLPPARSSRAARPGALSPPGRPAPGRARRPRHPRRLRRGARRTLSARGVPGGR